MAALPYWQLYPADFLADTLYLDVVETGAYLLLLMNYWQTGKPLPNDDVKLARIARCSLEQWGNVRSTVVGFFVERENFLVHERMEDDLENIRKKLDQRIEAGKASARAKAIRKRQREKQRNGNGKSTSVETPVEDSLEREGNDSINKEYKNITNTSIEDEDSTEHPIIAADQKKEIELEQQACAGLEFTMGTDWEPASWFWQLIAQHNVPRFYTNAAKSLFISHHHGRRMTINQANRKFMDWVVRDWKTDPEKFDETSESTDRSTVGRASSKAQQRRRELQQEQAASG